MGDLPATQDSFNIKPAAYALADLCSVANIVEDTPLTVGVYGAWGSGKTTFMRFMKKRLEDAPIQRQLGNTKNTVIWFDAWQYAQEDASLWRALLLTIVDEIRKQRVPEVAENDARIAAELNQREKADPKDNIAAFEKTLNDLQVRLYRSIEREELGGLTVDWSKLGKASARFAVRASISMLPVFGTVVDAAQKVIDVATGKMAEGEDAVNMLDAISRERSKIYLEQIRALDEFHRELSKLIDTWFVKHNQRLVVFIDDLDRCLPEQAISVLEAIKVFVNIPGCIFVLGMDRAIIQHGIRVRYKEFALTGNGAAIFPIEGRDYLEKIVQVAFQLPPPSTVDLQSFVEQRIATVPGLESPASQQKIVEIMQTGLVRNPRKIKRAINIFRLLALLANTQRIAGADTGVVLPLLAKLVVLQTSDGETYDRIIERPRYILELEDAARGSTSDVPAADRRRMQMLNIKPTFESLVGDSGKLADLIYFTRSVDSNE